MVRQVDRGATSVTFEFKRDETIQHAFRRIARAQIDDILADLTGRRHISRDKAVHESRKRLKRLRALLRLVRGAVSRSVRRRKNATFRDASRALSAARDAKVLVDAFDELLKHFAEHIQVETFAPVRAKLLARRRLALREQQRRGTADVVRSLRKARQRMAKVKLKGKDFSALRGGLKRTFRQGRQSFGVALYDRDPLKLHEWRKRVKDLWHQAELLEPIWPDVLRQFDDKAHALADCLGEDHDLFVLRQTLACEAESFGRPEDLEALLALIDTRRRELQQAAMQLGTRVYGEEPPAFVERMENYWAAWRRGDTVEATKES